MGIKQILNSDDPLSPTSIQRLLEHKEEDLFIDYKESFDFKDEKHWVGITTDAMAFANTIRGFLLFGIKDDDFTIVGLSEREIEHLTNTNLILQKLNRYVSPHFTGIRTKQYNTKSGIVVVMYIPESKGKTHVFVKDLNYKYPSGTTKQLIHTGMVFIRRSATNQVVRPEDLDFIINRRIDYYKESILSKISKVIEAPQEHHVLIFDPESSSNDDKSYTITDSDSAIPVKGMSFTIAPTTDIEECCGWISLSKRDPSFLPSRERLCYLYSVRDKLSLNYEQLLEIIRFSLLLELPIFFWLKSLSAEEIKGKLIKVFHETKNVHIKSDILRISSFFGKTFFMRLLKTLGDNISRLDRRSRKFPSDPFDLFHKGFIDSKKGSPKKHSEKLFREQLERQLSKIVIGLSKGVGGVMEKMEAKAIDCYLYARTDKYKRREGTNEEPTY